MNTATQNLVSLGKVCSILQAAPTAIERAAHAAGVRPALVLNGIKHFDESDVPNIRRELKRKGSR